MPQKVFLKLKKPYKLSLMGKYIKITQKKQKPQKKPKKPTGLFFKTRVFSNPVFRPATWIRGSESRRTTLDRAV
jgi:hypothetical protein